MHGHSPREGHTHLLLALVIWVRVRVAVGVRVGVDLASRRQPPTTMFSFSKCKKVSSAVGFREEEFEEKNKHNLQVWCVICDVCAVDRF